MRLPVFDIYAELLKEQCGLAIGADKSYLLESRLGSIAKAWGYASVEVMGPDLQFSPDPDLVDQIVEAMVSHDTSFFRDTKPFDIFKHVVMPYMAEARANAKTLRIWSAAASSGQEPYSLAMILKDAGTPWSGWTLDILGTDISASVLAQAYAGRYSQFEVQRGLPVQLLLNHFSQNADQWILNKDIRDMVHYELFNLLDDPSHYGLFDIIFCRNVIAGFDQDMKTELLRRLARQLTPDGFLFLGADETVLGLSEDFKPVPGQRGLYARSDSIHLKNAA